MLKNIMNCLVNYGISPVLTVKKEDSFVYVGIHNGIWLDRILRFGINENKSVIESEIRIERLKHKVPSVISLDWNELKHECRYLVDGIPRTVQRYQGWPYIPYSLAI